MNNTIKSKSNQRGSALIISMALLLILSLLTISSMTTALLQLKMVENLSTTLERSALAAQNSQTPL